MLQLDLCEYSDACTITARGMVRDRKNRSLAFKGMVHLNFFLFLFIIFLLMNYKKHLYE